MDYIVIDGFNWYFPVTFAGVRVKPPTDYVDKGITNAGTRPDYEGVIFSDGTVAVRWLTQFRSTSIWATMDEFLKVHGHPEYETRIFTSNGQSIEIPSPV